LRRLESRLFLAREARRSPFSVKIPPLQGGYGYLLNYLKGTRLTHFIEEEPIFVDNSKILSD
jgi:hypothetical protein